MPPQRTYHFQIKRKASELNLNAIAIDGPSGAGKSTLAKALAAKLGYIYVDTGALYRAVGLFALRRNIAPSDAGRLVPLLSQAKPELRYIGGEQRVLLCGEDVSQAIRQNEVSLAASDVSAIGAVRGFLFDLQRDIAKKNNVVMDGRDIGTVVLPNAQVKIFLTADDVRRAQRRQLELESKGESVGLQTLLEEMRLRDKQDSQRAVAPLRQADDAVLLDTSDMTLAQMEQAALAIVKERLRNDI